MKIAFFGSSNFAVPSLKILIESSHEVRAVVTQPDREKGRNLRISATPVKQLALRKNMKIYQPQDMNEAFFLKSLKGLSADLFIVVAFGGILPKSVLELPKTYSINLHPSLLPKYRGAAPINWAVINGETKTGLSVIRMNEKLDAGDIMLQRKVNIEREDTSESLGEKLSELGAILLLDAVRFIKTGRISFKKQKDTRRITARRLKKEDGSIGWTRRAVDIHNMVRGLVPWPGAFTFLDGKILRIWKSGTMPLYAKTEPGKITDIYKAGIIVACGKNSLVIKELQLEGGKRMKTESFLAGHKLAVGTLLGKGKV